MIPCQAHVHAVYIDLELTSASLWRVCQCSVPETNYSVFSVI